MVDKAVAVLGLGQMGSGMARALLAAGVRATVFNRSPEKAAPLAAAGAAVAASAADAVAGADVVVLSLADEAAVTAVLFGQLDGRLRPGMTVVDTSTVTPTFAREATKRLADHGVRRVEACVLGNPQMAAQGQLRVFAAGEESDVDSVRPVLDAIGQEVRFLGPAGSASVLKLAFNLMLGVQILGLAEAVTFAEAMGIDRGLLLDAFEGSGWRSAVLSFRGGFMRRKAYQPAAFRAALMRKDLDLARRESAELGVELPAVHCAAERYAELVAKGLGDEDAAAVVELR